MCQKTFARKWNVTNHMKIHKKTRVKTKCLYCIETFYAVPNLEIHCKTKHPDSPRDWISNDLEWKQVSNNDPNLPKCKICHKKFTRKENLRSHMQSYHLLNRPVLNCDVCNQSFNSNSNLKKHMRNFHLQWVEAGFNGFNDSDIKTAQKALDNIAGNIEYISP